MQKITTIETQPALERKKRVAGYSRVSSGKDAMLHSLSSQVSYFSTLIQAHNDWVYAGVYADEAKTGTKESRPEFQRLIADCRAGNIDMVITKSVSRFARNTVTLLESVRELKAMGVDIFFEEQNLHTMSGDGELMLTILASYAQEESKSVSENMKWRIKKNFEEGKPWNCTMLGYRYKNGVLTIHPDEAATVRRIFSEYLSGRGQVAIANGLNADAVPTRCGNAWHKNSVYRVLKNYTYTGSLLLQTTYREDFISKHTCINHGELPQYHATEAHEAIIDTETFEAVQAEMKRRAERHPPAKPSAERYIFTQRIICVHCGKHYRRKVTASGVVWICQTYNTRGKAACPAKQIPETALVEALGNIPFDTILADDANKLTVKSGDMETVLFWKDRSRSESWTPEMKEKARQKMLARNGDKTCQK